MKIPLVFAVVVSITYAVNTFVPKQLSQMYKTKVKKNLQECKAKFSSISNGEFKKLTTYLKTPSTRDEKCFALCYIKKRKYFKGPGTLDVAKMKVDNFQKYSNVDICAIANKIDETCVKRVQTEDDECETAVKFFKCRVGEAEAKNFTLAVLNIG